MADMDVKVIMFLKAPGSIKSLSLIKWSVLKKITMDQFGWLFLSEWQELRLTALYVLKIIWANGYMIYRRSRQALQQDLSSPIFSDIIAFSNIQTVEVLKSLYKNTPNPHW